MPTKLTTARFAAPGLVMALIVCALAMPMRAFAAAKPVITITIDDTVITQLLHLIATHDDSGTSIDNWIDLPGNKELLSVGAAEGSLTGDQLRANVKAVIDGTATDESQPKYSFGRVIVSDPADYQRMIDELNANEAQWLARCEARDEEFAPDGIKVNQTVYLQLGGDWDAINKDGAIFINMQFFHDYFSPSWAGLNLLIAHETFHAVQNTVFGNFQAADTPDDAFFTAISKLQREGMARYVEVETDPESYPVGTYGFFFRAIDQESLRSFALDMPLLSQLAAACYPNLVMQTYDDQLTSGLESGGPYYTIGEGMVQAINQYDGRQRLIGTVQKGPLDFFECYEGIARRHSELPQVPDSAMAHIDAMRKKFRDGKPSVTSTNQSPPFGVETPSHHD